MFGAIVVLILVAIAINYVVIGKDLSRTFDLPDVSATIYRDGTDLVEGERLAKLAAALVATGGI